MNRNSRCCYASLLGDCGGKLEREHYFSGALQDMIGPVKASGFHWLDREEVPLSPRKYAFSKMLCRKHHDDLDGLDQVAKNYFQNYMLLSHRSHINSGMNGSSEELSFNINGRELEKWFLKFICGAVASKNLGVNTNIQDEWVAVLFSRVAWPDHWSIYVELNEFIVKQNDAGFDWKFYWNEDNFLIGLSVKTFGVMTHFSFNHHQHIPPEALHRPTVLGVEIVRPDGSDVLVNIPAGEHVKLRFSWPQETTVNGDS